METCWGKVREGAGNRETGKDHVPEASKQEGRSRGPKAAKVPVNEDWKLTVGLTACVPGGTFTRGRSQCKQLLQGV